MTANPTGVQRSGFSPFGKLCLLASVASSACIPWIVGIIVKVAFDASGKPTHDWTEFTSPEAIAFEMTASAVFSLPALVFGILVLFATRSSPQRPQIFKNREAMAVGGLLLGGVGIVWNACLFFIEFDPVGFFLPAYWVFYLPGIALGWLVARIRRRRGLAEETPP